MISRDVELLAIGAGPSSLGLAVALEELAPELAANSLVIDRAPVVEWQTGMLLPWAKSQVSFLKDLVTQRNPRSQFSLLNYLHVTGRLDDFINMGSFTPYRVEMSAYLSWVAQSLSKVQVELGRTCLSVAPQRDPEGHVHGWLAALADGASIFCRYLVVGIGRGPYVPPVFARLPASRVVHSTQYRQRVAGLRGSQPCRVAVVGSSQSAAEMVRALRADLPGSDVAWIMRSIGLSNDQSTKFTNELYYPSFVDEFFTARPQAREQILREMYQTNYSCLTPATLESLYQDRYLDRLSGRDDRRMITMTDVTAAREEAGELVLDLACRRTGGVTQLHRDLVFLGTGFCREMPELIRRLAGDLGLERIEVTRHYQLVLGEPSTAACFVQGVNEDTHGIADSLLSVLAWRAQDITENILTLRNRAASGPAASRRREPHDDGRDGLAAHR